MRLPFIDSYVTLLRHNQQYRYLWLSQVISQTGDWFNLIASAALVAHLSGSGLAIGGLFLARLLPPFLLSPLVGVVADRFDRRKILIASDLLRAIVVLAFLFVRSAQDVWLLYVLTVLQLSISAFFEPTRAALMPSLVARKDLVTANALDGTTWSTMLAVGAALGGLATAVFGITTAFLIDAATFVLSAWFIGQVRPTFATVEPETVRERDTGWQAFVGGLHYLRRHPPVLAIALLKASKALAFGGMAVVEVTFAKEIFPIGADGSGTLGLIYVATGLSTGLGPLIARRITGEKTGAMYWAILFCYLSLIVGYVMIGYSTSLSFLLLATFIRTLGSGISWVYSSALLQMTVPDKFLGRVFAFDFAMMTLAASVSTLWVGWAKDSLAMGPQQIGFLLAGVPAVMAVGWAVFMALHFKRRPLTPQQSISS
ncbi:MAG: MFS transporter [Anaerolineales bacterium]|nr:MFS transporter [Anaerolineales bacterium]